MRYAINRTIHAEIPKRFLEKYELAIERGRMAKGIPEFKHPKDYFEILDLRTGQRWSNHPEFKPHRKWFVAQGSLILAIDYKDYDFDHLPLPIPVIDHLTKCNEWYWRRSTSYHGLHVMCKHDLSMYDDQTRERATEIRGYSWFWSVKNGHKSNLWERGSKMKAIKFMNEEDRKQLRRKPPKHKKFMKSTTLR